MVVVDEAVVGWAACDGEEAVEDGEETDTGDGCPFGCAAYMDDALMCSASVLPPRVAAAALLILLAE